MPLTRECKDAIFGFVGYGVEHPRFVFVGREEGSDSRLVNLEAREAFPPFHDRDTACQAIAAAYHANGLHAEAQRYVDAHVPGTEPTWALAAKSVAGSRAPATAWQTEYANLGSVGGDTLLMELFPLPKQGTICWPPEYVPEFGYPNQNHYYDAVWPRDVQPSAHQCARADLLAAVFSAIPLSRKCTVFCYGRGGRRTEFWHRFDRLLAVNGGWTIIIPEVAEIARHTSGAVVARLAHPSRNGIPAGAIPQIIAAIQELN